MSDELEGTEYESVHLRRTPQELALIRKQQQEAAAMRVPSPPPTPPGSPAAGAAPTEADFASAREWAVVVGYEPPYTVPATLGYAHGLAAERAARQAAEAERDELAEWKAEQQQHIIRSCVKLLNAGMPESAGPGVEDGIAWLTAKLAAAEGREAELRDVLDEICDTVIATGKLPMALVSRAAALLARRPGGGG